MSIRHMTKVWEAGPEKQGHLLVMLALADYANDAGECWPSIRSIAQKSRMTDRGVQKILRTLEAEGWIETEVGNGRKGCNCYTIKPRTTFAPNDVHPEQRNTKTPNDDAKTPNDDAQNPEPRSPEPSGTVKNHQKEPSVGHGQWFDLFWSVVPRKKKKDEAKRAFARAVKKADPQTIIDGMAAYAESRDGQDPKYTAHPTSWLNQGRWEDEPDAMPSDFHNQLSQALGGTHELPRTHISDNRPDERLPAALPSPRTSGHEPEPDRNQGYCRKSELAHRRFRSG